jgi:hypothetical protein
LCNQCGAVEPADELQSLFTEYQRRERVAIEMLERIESGNFPVAEETLADEMAWEAGKIKAILQKPIGEQA